MTVLWLCVLAVFSLPWHPRDFTASLVQVDSVSHRVIVSFNLADCSIQKNVEFRASVVLTIATGTSHKVEFKGDRVSFAQFRRRFFVCMQHFSHHHLSQGVPVDSIRPFVDENIVEYFGEASDAVDKWNCGVEAEQGQVKVPSRNVL